MAAGAGAPSKAKQQRPPPIQTQDSAWTQVTAGAKALMSPGAWADAESRSMLAIAVVAVAAFTAGTWLAETMHENTHGWSRLSHDERLASHYSEQAFYASYYFRTVEAPSIGVSLTALLADDRVEVPNTVNALNRFNIVPEWLLGVTYRVVGRALGVQPYDWLLGAVFYLSGLQLAVLSIIGSLLARSWVAGAVTAAGFMFNIFEMSRVHSHPLLRESFGLPFLWLQLLGLIWVLRVPAARQPSTYHQLAIVIPGIAFLTAWQFAPFVLFLEVCAMLGTLALGYMAPSRFKQLLTWLLHAAAGGLLTTAGNRMLVTSLFVVLTTSCLVGVHVGWILSPAPTARLGKRLWTTVRTVGAALLPAIAAKWALGFFITEDTHVFSILRAKLSTYEDFDTAMYLCGGPYGTLPGWVVSNLMESTTLPRAAVVWVVAFLLMAVDYSRGTARMDPALVMLCILLVAFVGLGAAIMRLMVFMNPLMAVLGSLLVSRSWLLDVWAAVTCARSTTTAKPRSGATAGSRLPSSSTVIVWAVVCPIVMALMISGGYLQLESRLHAGQSSQNHRAVVQLAQWVRTNTPQDAVFASALGPVSSILLMTQRRIAVHPHAEDLGMRLRYRSLYQMYAHRDEDSVYAMLAPLHADYLVISYAICDGKCVTGRGLDSVAELGEPTALQLAASLNATLPTGALLPQVSGRHTAEPFCFYVTEQPLRRFRGVFQNDAYVVIEMLR